MGPKKPGRILPCISGCIQDLVLLSIDTRFNNKAGIRSLDTILDIIPKLD